MNNQKDFVIAQNELWYRIPKDKAPSIVRNNEAKIIAFYHTKIFEKEKFSIRWFSLIKQVSIVKRKQLFPTETNDPRRENEYYKIEFTQLQQLLIPIVSLRPRWVLFIPTTEEKFFSAKEINFLFAGSILEDKFWNALLKRNIYPERQYFLSVKEKNYFLDFAVFCKDRNINIECDGDFFHMKEDSVRNDKQRNNILESEGWSVLRFTSKDIEYKLDDTVRLVMDTANKYGGVQDIKNLNQYSYLSEDDQLRIFD